MILAVAVALGVRRALSRENIYTAKLVPRGHAIPKALHANMFLVRAAKDVMEKNFVAVPAEARLDEFLRQPEHRAGMLHVIITQAGSIMSVVRINAGLRTAIAELEAGVTFGDIARSDFTIVGEHEVAFDIIERMWREGRAIAVVARGDVQNRTAVSPGDVIGVITKEHVADAVAASIQAYPR
jgi:CIC family chloride channel protein